MNIFEGGNVFKDSQGVSLTQRINKADVNSTIAWLERVTGIDLTGTEKDQAGVSRRYLGSTGRTDTSGDLDLTVLTTDANKQQLVNSLTAYLSQVGVPEQDWFNQGRKKQDGWIDAAKADEIHFRTPIGGNPSRGFVQTDFNLYPDSKTLSWAMFYKTGTSPGFKGMYRNVLLSSLAKPLGITVGSNGVLDRATKQLITLDPERLAKLVLGSENTADDLATVESIYAALTRDPKRDAKLADFRDYLSKSGISEPMLSENEVHFLARLRDRIVNQGMQPLIEHEIIIEGKDPRIPYVEDLVFKKGLNGLIEAIDIIKQSAEKTAQYVSIKWDGSPAVIFGRLPDGQFVLTDKAGASATGYDGLATSPEMMANIMSQRDRTAAARGQAADRTEKLTPMYRDIWPYFEAAVPRDFRGFVKGDLLYYPTLPYQEQTGAWVFRPNRTPGGIEYKIPINSPVGQQIQGTQVGIAVHTQMDEPDGIERPITQDPSKMFTPVPGLMITGPYVENLQNIEPNARILGQLRKIVSGQLGQDIKSLLNPADLRAMQITDLPALMERYINSLKGTDFSQATPSAFLAWLQDGNTSPRKFNNIYTHLISPKRNASGMAAAFVAWSLLEQLANDLNRQLDLQQPGQEGWVMAPPAGRAKLVSRRAGGFGARAATPNVT